ncbi:MAG TPA: zinc-dependent alcohol dehydrogenase family protein [Anaerolineae bacterium]|nr:zinc-dependent alcohol dehydrogenase family protein [Anaerolineae bacterium]
MKALLLPYIVNLSDDVRPLQLATLPDPVPRKNEILVKVSACGVCHTELDEIEGRTPPPQLPIVLGHQIVGRVADVGVFVTRFHGGERVGVAWIHSACGQCPYCLSGRENLCENFQATGRDVQGGYAEYLTVAEDFAYRLPDVFSDVEAAPLLCAGAIGYRSLMLTGLRDGQSLGLTGFGASAHLVLQMAHRRYPQTPVYVFARSEAERKFARELGAVWAGQTEAESPIKLDAIIDTTPVWTPSVEALKNLVPGGRLVINAIRKEDVDKSALTRLDYARDLWQEKEIKSVANVTRHDVSEFLLIAAEIPLKPEVQTYALEDANQALWELKQRQVRGAKVLVL